jgi:acyl carrier protein
VIIPPDELERDVIALVARVLRLDAGRAHETHSREGTPCWDSLKHVEIVFALEDRYGVRFDEAEFSMLDSTAAIARRLREHLGA